MILPIVYYGHDVLRKQGVPVLLHDPHIEGLVGDMRETLEHAGGCGLAACQVGHPVDLFVVDSRSTFLSMDGGDRSRYFGDDAGIKETFINAEIIESGDDFTEGAEESCLSLPGLSGYVCRPWRITVRYYDVRFQKQTRTFSGYTARVIQHEYDHTSGILYIDRLSPLRRSMLRNRLNRLRKGSLR